MKERIVEVVRELEAVIRRTGEEFPLINKYNQRIPWEDYGNPCIPASRVKADREEMVRILNRYFEECRGNEQEDQDQRDTQNMEDFSFVYAAYCNLYIKKGMYISLGTDDFETVEGGWFKGPEDQVEYFKCLWRGIFKQDYSCFIRALELRPRSAAAAMYLFVRAASKFCMVISQEQNTDELETEVWKYFDMLPGEYQEYVLGEGNFRRETDNLANDPNLLPYIEFKSIKEYLVTYVLQYYGDILKEMGLEAEAGGAFQKPVELYLKFLFEKLHVLLKERDPEPEESFSAQLAFPGRNATIFYRNTYLHLPVILPVKTSKEFFLSRRGIFRQKQELERQRQELEQQRRRNREMMDFYIHSWKHISYPQTVKSVAEELRKKDLPLSNKLFKAYNSERVLKGNLQRIQYAFSDRPDEVSKAFSQGFYCAGASSGRSVLDLLGEGLDLVLFKMLMEDTDGSRWMNLCRDSLRMSLSLDQLRQSYVAAFVDDAAKQGNNVGGPADIFEWFDRNIFKMERSVDRIWQEIPVMENSFAESQLTEIFAELFTNLLTHGAGWCRVALKSDEQNLSIAVCNGLGRELHGSRKGLAGLENIVNKLNMNEVENAVTGELTGDGAFTTTVILRRGLMYKRGRRR